MSELLLLRQKCGRPLTTALTVSSLFVPQAAPMDGRAPLKTALMGQRGQGEVRSVSLTLDSAAGWSRGLVLVTKVFIPGLCTHTES
uniref:Uncharacterized protein n=1 Tax=Knipowitschia caucasica TaxID=637954 RepID=A0AAV2JHU7_KNICA